VAIRLALKGFRVSAMELNSLQKDFVAFRKWKYGLDNLQILDEVELGPERVLSR